MKNLNAHVPHLTTALTGPLHDLERHILMHQLDIEAWFREQWRNNPPPVHCSVDLRNAGFKLAPIDTNLFPAGFNNLNPDFMALCTQAVQSHLSNHYPNVGKILLIPENHTRNLFYLESLFTLYRIIQQAGYDIHLGTLNTEVTEPTSFTTHSGQEITLSPVIRQGERLGLKGFDPDLIWLNNDLSNGVPELLRAVEQPIRPPLLLGWSSRLKSDHFSFYKQVAEEFAERVGIDPWLINPLFQSCGDVDFMQREGETCLMVNTEKLLHAVKKKYDEYGVEQAPYAIVKADAGTYGMGVMSVKSAEEMQRLNRKQRTRMASAKGSRTVAQVIIQEGVYTFETWKSPDNIAEPVVYMLGHHVVGGFYRVHSGRGITDNLNAPGMHFEHLAFVESCMSPDKACEPSECSNRFYAYGVVARLALLAAARELQAAGVDL